jgi:glycosyltransferase involved in cell wall biosynthesis
MKVVVQSDARIWGGNEKWLLMVATGLVDRGHEVLVSCKPGRPVAERAAAAGLRVTHHRPGGDADLPRALGFAAMLRRERPDAVLLSALKRVFWAGWAARRAGVGRVVERLGIEHDLPRKWKYRHAFRHYVDAMIVNSGAIRDRWLTSAPWYPADEVHVVLNGVRAPAPRDRTVRDELQLAADVPLVAGAGRFEHRKGFDLLLAALSWSDPEAHLAIAGDGPEEAELRDRAERVGVGDRVHWLGFREDLDDVLLGADVFVLPSRKEGMANVMLEAMAAGCLVVATDVSGVREALGASGGRERAGWIVACDDASALGEALGEALGAVRGGGGLVAAMRAELRWRVEHWFSPERTVRQTEAVLAGRAVASGDVGGGFGPDGPDTGRGQGGPHAGRRERSAE